MFYSCFSGKLLVTNLRIIWHSQAMPRVNLCMHCLFFWLFGFSFSLYFLSSQTNCCVWKFNFVNSIQSSGIILKCFLLNNSIQHFKGWEFSRHDISKVWCHFFSQISFSYWIQLCTKCQRQNRCLSKFIYFSLKLRLFMVVFYQYFIMQSKVCYFV